MHGTCGNSASANAQGTRLVPYILDALLQKFDTVGFHSASFFPISCLIINARSNALAKAWLVLYESTTSSHSINGHPCVAQSEQS